MGDAFGMNEVMLTFSLQMGGGGGGIDDGPATL